MSQSISLIGIYGFIGSGKDTVAKIIQLLCCRPGISDAEVVEKVTSDSYADIWDIQDNSSWDNKKFAGNLKQVASLLTGISPYKFESQEFKKSYMPEEWWDFPDKPKTWREFLQKLGTEAIRDQIHPNAWVNSLFSTFNPEDDRWIVTDMRFPNEYKAVKERGGITIMVQGTPCWCGKQKRCTCMPENAHISEVALLDAPGIKWDYFIYNVSTPEHLINEVRKMMLNFKFQTND